ncbi:MAG: response regulator transcription factor, partial [Chloroflexi bacterium]|nr:response regulator transcription factor [Chloroflexota bacterium]
LAIVAVQEDGEAVSTALLGLGLDVRRGETSTEIVRMIYGLQPDIVVLDVRRPSVDGLDICRRLRQDAANLSVSQVPIMLLAGDDAEVDAVLGLELGADDVVQKPYGVRLLQARVKALLRRASFAGESPFVTQRFLSSGDLTVDLVGRHVSRAGERIRVTPRELELLALFVRHPGQILTRDEILCHVWRDQVPRESHTLNVHVRWLRCKIEPDPSQPTRLQTVTGRGYIFVE